MKFGACAALFVGALLAAYSAHSIHISLEGISLGSCVVAIL